MQTDSRLLVQSTKQSLTNRVCSCVRECARACIASAPFYIIVFDVSFRVILSSESCNNKHKCFLTIDTCVWGGTTVAVRS